MRATYDVLLVDPDRQIGYVLYVDASLTEAGNLDTIDRVRLIGGCVIFPGSPTTIDLVPRDEHEQRRAGEAILRELEGEITDSVERQIREARENAAYEAAELGVAR